MDKLEGRIFALLKLYEQGMATGQQVSELEKWYQSFHDRPDIMAGLSRQEQLAAREGMLNRISALIPHYAKGTEKEHKRPAFIWQRWAVAASLALICAVGGYFALDWDQPKFQQLAALKQDFAPGSNRAVLELSGGERIILDGANNGQLAAQGGSLIKKTADGEVVYDDIDKDAPAVMNTMSTPRGGQYHLVLSDGTGVWLNAASSITYVSGFTGNKREVEITGEVYFEVAHNPKKPFLVRSGNQLVEVLGTRFNINAYADEGQIRTTLLEGGVDIISGTHQKRLFPGQQAALKGHHLNVLEADTQEAIAWKEGYFQFVDADIQTVMRQISRWYDVEVVFLGPLSKQKFTGRISRHRKISRILSIVQSYQDVNLAFEGRRIMVR